MRCRIQFRSTGRDGPARFRPQRVRTARGVGRGEREVAVRDALEVAMRNTGKDRNQVLVLAAVRNVRGRDRSCRFRALVSRLCYVGNLGRVCLT